MRLVYHGTSAERAVMIAKEGVILSPAHQTIKDIRNSFGGRSIRSFPNEETFAHHFGGDVEAVVYSNLAKKTERERCELCSVILTPSILIAQNRAGNGVVLGCEITPEIAQIFPENWESHNAIYFPNKFRILSLREVYISSDLDLKTREKIQGAFLEYSPRISFFAQTENQ